MASEYAPLDLSNTPELRRVAEEVRKTRRPQTLRLADGVVAVVKPERKATTRKAPRRLTPTDYPTTYTLESAFGSVPTPPHLKGKDIEEILREAKEDYAERIARD
jgi:hypothetical protein